MSIRLLVLGIIDREHTAHGYKIYSELLTWQAHHWAKVRPGSIYHALAQLEKEGMLRPSGTPNGKESSSGPRYQLTTKGKGELILQIEKALAANEQEHFAAGLAFMHKLPRGRVLELVRQRLTSYQQGCAYMHSLPKETRTSDPSKHPAILGSWTALFDATEKWLHGFIREIEEGRYTFAED